MIIKRWRRGWKEMIVAEAEESDAFFPEKRLYVEGDEVFRVLKVRADGRLSAIKIANIIWEENYFVRARLSFLSGGEVVGRWVRSSECLESVVSCFDERGVVML